MRRQPRSAIEITSSNHDASDSCWGLSIPFFVIKATAVASLGGVLFGYDAGIIAGALPQVTRDFSLSNQEEEWAVGILYLSAGFGAACGGMLCDAIGRKSAILVTDIIFVLAAILLCSAPNVAQFMVGRVVVGFGISISAIADVSYLHEIAPQKWRGAIVSVNEACISLGFLIAFASGAIWKHTPHGWRYMFGVSGLLGIAQFIGMLAMPESPVWLSQKGKEEESREALRQINGRIISSEERLSAPSEAQNNNKSEENNHSTNLDIIADAQDASTSHTQQEARSYETSIRRTLGDKCNSCFHVIVRYRYQCCIALFLSMITQFCGQVSVLSYAPLIFSQLDDSKFSITIWIGAVKFLTTVVVICSIEYRGRQFLLLSGMFVIVIGQFLVAFAFSIGNAIEGDTTDSAIICGFIGILVVVLGFSMSFGPLGWVIISEIFPDSIRGRALGASTVITYLCASLVTSTFLSTEKAIGARNIFFLYGLITLGALVFVIIAIPETGKKSPEEIDEVIRQMWLWNKFQRREIVDRNEPVDKPSQTSPAQSHSLQVHGAELT